MFSFLRVAVVLFSLNTCSSWARLGAQYQMALGNPSEATTDPSNKKNFLIKREEYAESYNSEKEEPNWVSWSLSSEDTGHSGRSKDFFVDTALPAGFNKATTETFSGFDRGHMCPSGDRTISKEHNDVTFLMSNMVPQKADNNRGPWEKFESYCRSLAFQGKEVLIICGPSCFTGTTVASGVAIPKYTWKIAVVRSPNGTITSSSRTIAIKMPNEQGILGNSWNDYVTSVAEIEKDTGFTFFKALPTSVASSLRVVIDKEASGSRKGSQEKGQETAVASTIESQQTITTSTTLPPPAPKEVAVVPKAIAPPPVTLPAGPMLAAFKKSENGPTEFKVVASAKVNGGVAEITDQQGKLLILGSNLLVALLPLPPTEKIPLNLEQVNLALSKFDSFQSTDTALKEFVADGRSKWVAIATELKTPASVAVVGEQPPVKTQQTALSEVLDVPTAAGVEEPEPSMWVIWFEKIKSWTRILR